jgi:hypothetical protein
MLSVLWRKIVWNLWFGEKWQIHYTWRVCDVLSYLIITSIYHERKCNLFKKRHILITKIKTCADLVQRKYIYTQSATGTATLCVRLLPTKMAVTLLFVFLTVAGLATGRNFHLQNNLGYTVWVGIQGNAGLGQPDNGGFTLYARHTVSNGQERCGCGSWSARGRKLHWGYWKH